MRNFGLACLVLVIILGLGFLIAEAKVTTFTIAGSTSVQPIIEILAQEYMALHPQTRINVQGGGSSAGVKAAATGTAAIGMASRQLHPEERKLWKFTLAYDSIAVIVHPTNPIANLTTEQIHDIFNGEITDWSQVGGKPGPINVITREEGSGTRSAFEELILKKKPIIANAIVQGSTGAVKATISRDPSSIGYISSAIADQTIKILKDNINRPFLLLCATKPSGAVADFISWLRTPEAIAILTAEGLVPVK